MKFLVTVPSANSYFVSMNLYSEFKKIILSKKLIGKNDHLLVGVSGGLDSVVLLHLLSQLKKEYTFTLRVAHLNYHLRGRQSDLDEAYVGKLCKSLNIPLQVKSAHFKSNSNIQDRARKIRYDYFEKIALKWKCHKVFLAHHANDQVETFYLKILRGAGLQGLSGMKLQRDFHEGSRLQIVRPLLSITKVALKEYAQREKLKWREDKSNLKEDYLRNFVRLKILPLFLKVQPRVIEKVSEGVEVLQQEHLWLENYVYHLIKKRWILEKDRMRLSLKFIKKQAIPIRYRIYLELFKQFEAAPLTPKRKYLISMDEMVMAGKSSMKLSFSAGYGATLEKGDLVLLRWRKQKLDQRGFFS